MSRIIINLVTLGNLKHQVNFKEICTWQSSLFSTEHEDHVAMIPDALGYQRDDWTYPDEQLDKFITPSHHHAFTFGVINAPLQDNYYIRRLPNNVIILSLDQTAEILLRANLTIENFMGLLLIEWVKRWGEAAPEPLLARG